MARQKKYYSHNEIENNLYTSGAEWMYESGVIYVGLYHKYSTGEVYTESVWNVQTSKKLIAYEDISTNTFKYKKLKTIKTTYNSLIGYTVQITNKDIENKFITRYFIKKINETSILEISKKTYEQWSNSMIDPNMYIAISLLWHISGDIAAISQKNQKSIILAGQTIPQIKTYLTDLTQYYTDTDYVIPKDINGLDS
jgi:hypothetical protein